MSPVRRGTVVGRNLVGSPFDWKTKSKITQSSDLKQSVIFHPQIICIRFIKFLQQKWWSNCN